MMANDETWPLSLSGNHWLQLHKVAILLAQSAFWVDCLGTIGLPWPKGGPTVLGPLTKAVKRTLKGMLSYSDKWDLSSYKERWFRGARMLGFYWTHQWPKVRSDKVQLHMLPFILWLICMVDLASIYYVISTLCQLWVVCSGHSAVEWPFQYFFILPFITPQSNSFVAHPFLLYMSVESLMQGLAQVSLEWHFETLAP